MRQLLLAALVGIGVCAPAKAADDYPVRPIRFISISAPGSGGDTLVRLLADRLMVMKSGRVVEQGLTDQVLDDPQHGYTQLLVSSVLQV